MKAKQATVKPKPVSQLVKHACFCPPTKHDTKLDQLNKAKEIVVLTLAKLMSHPRNLLLELGCHSGLVVM